MMPEIDSEQIVTYRAICPWAVAALLLGGTSALALVHPGLWIVPPLAAIMAVYALRTIVNRKAELIGSSLALAGLAMALFFGVWGPARLVTRQAKLYSEARSRAEEWIDLVRDGRLHEAYELHLKADERQSAGISLADYYGDLSQPAAGPKIEPSTAPPLQGVPAPPRPGPQHAIREFWEQPALKAFVSAAAEDRVRFGNYELLESLVETKTEKVMLRYELLGGSGTPAKPLNIVMTRVLDRKSKTAQWFVELVSEPRPGQ